MSLGLIFSPPYHITQTAEKRTLILLLLLLRYNQLPQEQTLLLVLSQYLAQKPAIGSASPQIHLNSSITTVTKTHQR